MVTWHVHPDVVIWIGLIEGAYLYGLRAIGRPRGLRATPGQMAWFTGGILVLYLTAGTPLHDLAEQRLVMMEMLQHMLFMLVAAPMLLLGTPGWFLRALLQNRTIFKVMRTLTSPIVALAVFNITLLLLHLPASVDFTLQHHRLHFLDHAALVVTAVLMWFPVLSPVPDLLPRLTPPVQMLYLFAQSFVPTVLASFMTLSSTIIYPFYATVPRTWGISARDDQLIAGLIMKLGGGAILWLAIGIVFFTWVARHNREEREAPKSDALQWEDVEAELDRMGLTSSPPKAY